MLGVRRADAVVDVDAVGFRTDRDDIGTELVEHRRRDVVRRAVRAVDDDAPALEVELVRERALAELDVAAPGVLDAARLAELRRRHARERARHHAFDRLLDRVRKLGARLGKELDPVVVERIVRRADHDPRGEAQRARQVGDRGRGERSGQVDVDARRGESRLQRRLQHVPGDPRVLADEHGGAHAVARRYRPRARAPPPIPSFSTTSGVIGGSPTSPRTPSVPK